MGTEPVVYDDVVAALARLDAANGLGAVVARDDARRSPRHVRGTRDRRLERRRRRTRP